MGGVRIMYSRHGAHIRVCLKGRGVMFSKGGRPEAGGRVGGEGRGAYSFFACLAVVIRSLTTHPFQEGEGGSVIRLRFVGPGVGRRE